MLPQNRPEQPNPVVLFPTFSKVNTICKIQQNTYFVLKRMFNELKERVREHSTVVPLSHVRMSIDPYNKTIDTWHT